MSSISQHISCDSFHKNEHHICPIKHQFQLERSYPVFPLSGCLCRSIINSLRGVIANRSMLLSLRFLCKVYRSLHWRSWRPFESALPFRPGKFITRHNHLFSFLCAVRFYLLLTYSHYYFFGFSQPDFKFFLKELFVWRFF